MNRRAWSMALLWGILFYGGAVEAQTYSELWGKKGEKWSPQSRLPDFSYAGYHSGESPLPHIKAVTDVTQYGAKGDGKTDCTQAFIDAIAATDKGAITIPPGRYVISDILWIKKPGIVLRGAGPDKTIIECPKTLEDVRPNMGKTSTGKPTSNYSWSGGFIWVQGKFSNATIGAVLSESKRGTFELKMEKAPTNLRKGQRVIIELQDDREKTLLDHLYSGDAGDTSKIRKPTQVRMINRIAAVDGTGILLERPLRLDIRKSWTPVLRTYTPTVYEVGIENLTIIFPETPYPGHTFEERGMNGIALNKVADCWVRNVKISNSDSGIYLKGDFCTADGIVLDSGRREGNGTTGHHGISLGHDCLVQNFDFKTHFVHDFTVSAASAGNVIKNGKGINLSFDHHKKAPYENLFCNIDIGKGTEMWRSGGGSGLGKHCGARGTFWCINSDSRIKAPPEAFGPDSLNMVGLKTSESSRMEQDGVWIEKITPQRLKPTDLHAAQLAKRLMEKTDP